MEPSNPAEREIIDLGEEVYTRQYKEEYELEHAGKYVAVDVDSEAAYTADSPEAALQDARASSPQGRFHVMLVHGPIR